MPIETKITGLSEYGHYMKALFCGDAGSGKTLISSTFPNPFYISAEGGLMSIARRFIPYTELQSSQDLKELLTILRQPPTVRAKMLGAPSSRIDTVVLDTIDEIQKIFMKERIKTKKDESFSFKDYGWLKEQMEGAIRAFRNLDMNVILTAHIKEQKDEETGRVTFKPGMAGQVSDWIPSAVDLAFLLTSRTVNDIVDGKAQTIVQRFMQTYPDTQHPWVKDRSGRVSQEFPINFEDDYERLYDLIYAGLDEEFAAAKAASIVKLKAIEGELRADPFAGSNQVADQDIEKFAESLQTKT